MNYIIYRRLDLTRGFWDLRHRLGRVGDAPWYRYRSPITVLPLSQSRRRSYRASIRATEMHREIVGQ
jgi:hypothetical protein